MFDKALSATEHAELYGALAAMRWPTKAYFHSPGRTAPDPDETGLVGAWNMRPVAGKVHDISGNGNDGAINQVIFARDILGHVADFSGEESQYIEMADSASLDVANNFSISVWAKTVASDGVAIAKWSAGTAQRSYALVCETNSKLWLSTDGASFEAEAGSVTINDGVWHHIVVVLVSGVASFYTDGQFDVDRTFSGQSTALVGTSTLRIGDETSGEIGSTFDGKIAFPKIYNRALSATEIAAEYAKGAKALTSTNWGARETSAAVAGGNLANTPFEVIIDQLGRA
jgi:hypothetical protein